jgi:hypothetical protein
LPPDPIALPGPQVAFDPSKSDGSFLVQLMARYARERAVRDERLGRVVTIAAGGIDLGELCRRLSRETGVSFEADPGVADRKLSVFARAVPARDLMLQVKLQSRLEWFRSGQGQPYRYRLSESIQDRLQIRDAQPRDEDALLLDASDQIAYFVPYLDLPDAEVRRLAEQARLTARRSVSPEREAWQSRALTLAKMAQQPVVRDGIRLFSQLAPSRLVELRTSGRLAFPLTGDEGPVERQVVSRWREALLGTLARRGGYDPSRIRVSLAFVLSSRGADGADLSVRLTAEAGEPGSKDYEAASYGEVLAQSRVERLLVPALLASPPAESPLPDVARKVSLKPSPADASRAGRNAAAGIGDTAEWVDSGEVMADLHRRTGLSVVSDYYLRAFPASDFEMTGIPLRDALDRTAARLAASWDASGGFVRFRRVNDYAEREKEIPNRLLERWRDARRRLGYLSLDALAEIAALEPGTLSEPDRARAAVLLMGLEEWPLAGKARVALQRYSLLSPAERREAQTEAGLPLPEMAPGVLGAFLALGEPAAPPSPEDVAAGRFWIHLRLPGAYEWVDWARARRSPFPARIDVSAPSRPAAEETVAAILAARKKTDAEIRAGLEEVRGPEAGISSRLRVGPHYELEEVGREDRSAQGQLISE